MVVERYTLSLKPFPLFFHIVPHFLPYFSLFLPVSFISLNVSAISSHIKPLVSNRKKSWSSYQSQKDYHAFIFSSKSFNISLKTFFEILLFVPDVNIHFFLFCKSWILFQLNHKSFKFRKADHSFLKFFLSQYYSTAISLKTMFSCSWDWSMLI